MDGPVGVGPESPVAPFSYYLKGNAGEAHFRRNLVCPVCHSKYSGEAAVSVCTYYAEYLPGFAGVCMAVDGGEAGGGAAAVVAGPPDD